MLSGSNLEELNYTSNALRKCITLARSLLLEREYLKFIKPDLISIPSFAQQSVTNENDFVFEKSSERVSINDPAEENFLRAPYLFDKMMER